MKKKETKSQRIYDKTTEATSGLDSLDGGTKVLLVGGACVFLLIILYCLHRICCYIIDPIDEVYAQHIKNAQSSHSNSENSSGRASTSAKKRESQPPSDSNRQERKPRKTSATPKGQPPNARSPSHGPQRAPSLQPVQMDPTNPEQQTQEPSFDNAAEQERLRQRQFEDTSDEATQSRIDKAAKHLKKLLRLSNEVKLKRSDQSNILDALGAVDQPAQPVATQSSVTPAAAPCVDPAMQELQGTQETPKIYGW